MIPTVEEPKGMPYIEHCFFCDTPTRMWHWRTNQPVCKTCAKINKVSSLPKCTPTYKPPTKSEYLK